MKSPLRARQCCQSFTCVSSARCSQRRWTTVLRRAQEAGSRCFSAPAAAPVAARQSHGPASSHNDVLGDSSQTFHPVQPLADVLSALQTQNSSQLTTAMVHLGKVLQDPKHSAHQETHSQVLNLPAPTTSEMLRCLDPLTYSESDIAHGHHLGPNFVSHSPSSVLLNEKGVRKVRVDIFTALWEIIKVRRQASVGLTISDYEAAMRCASAAFDREAVKLLFGWATQDGLGEERSIKTWTDFLQGRFLTEPSYYQFDKSRVVVLPRDMYRASGSMSHASFKSLEKLRMQANATKQMAWNQDEDGADIRRILRRRSQPHSMNSHWIRGLYYGHEVDEEALCTAMVALARSGSLYQIRHNILQSFFGIHLTLPTDPLEIEVTGGVEFPPTSSRKPTARLLNAVVEAFGCMSHIAAALRLIEFISKRWNIAIPAETWSSLLQWTHLNSTQPYRTMRREAGGFANTHVTQHHVKHVFDTMISEPYNVVPTIDDYNVIIKVLIRQKSFRVATELIRDKLMPHYHRLVQQHEQALLDDTLANMPLTSYDSHNDPSSSSSQPSDARPSTQSSSANSSASPDHTNQLTPTKTTPITSSAATAAAKKDYLQNLINRHFHNMLTRIQPANTSVARVALPNLLLEFSDFFPSLFTYRVPGGYVQIDRRYSADVTDRQRLVRVERRTLPTRRSGRSMGENHHDDATAAAEDREEASAAAPSGFEWPWEEQVLVRHGGKIPMLRRGLGRVGEKGFWGSMKREMMI